MDRGRNFFIHSMMKLIIVSEIPDPSMEPVLQLSVTPKRLPNDIIVVTGFTLLQG